MASNFDCYEHLVEVSLNWGVPLLGTVVAAALVTPVVERINFLWNRNAVREKQFEEFARALSTLIFNAELIHEFYIQDGDTEEVTSGYNEAITTFRANEYVYLSWARRFWDEVDYPVFENLMGTVRALDKSIHRLNEVEGDVPDQESAKVIAVATGHVRDLAIKLLTSRKRARWYNNG